jgi:putative salt-induced outer membrane protein
MKFYIALISILLFCHKNSFSQEEKEKNLKVHIEAGGTFSKGNSNQQSLFSKNNLEYKKDKWTEIFKSRLENTKVNRVRSKERYDLNNQLRYNISEKNFRVFEAEYIDDRYAGYDYRASLTYGYGRNFIENEKTKFSSQLSFGARQSKFTNGQSESSPLIRFTSNLEHKFKDDIIFNENLDISIDKDVVITKSDSSLKIRLKSVNKSLFLQLGYFLENRSNSSTSNAKKTDSIFMTMIGLDF